MSNISPKLRAELKSYAKLLYGRIKPCVKSYMIYYNTVFFFFNDAQGSTHTTTADLVTGKIIPKNPNA